MRIRFWLGVVGSMALALAIHTAASFAQTRSEHFWNRCCDTALRVGLRYNPLTQVLGPISAEESTSTEHVVGYGEVPALPKSCGGGPTTGCRIDDGELCEEPEAPAVMPEHPGRPTAVDEEPAFWKNLLRTLPRGESEEKRISAGEPPSCKESVGPPCPYTGTMPGTPKDAKRVPPATGPKPAAPPPKGQPPECQTPE